MDENIKQEIEKMIEVDFIKENTITLKEEFDCINSLTNFQEKIKKLTGSYPAPCDVNILDWTI